MQEFSISNIRNRMSPMLDRTLKKYTIRYYQLKVGYKAIRTFLAKKKRVKTPKCWWCEAYKQTVIYFYTKSRRWNKEQKKRKKDLGQHGINWQSRPKKRLLSRLFANELATRLMLKFLKDMEVSSRERAREKKLK